jgi:hypothetical protein
MDDEHQSRLTVPSPANQESRARTGAVEFEPEGQPRRLTRIGVGE